MLNQLILKNNEMKICITTIHDRLGVIAMINRTNKCGLVEARNRVNNINITPLILDIPQSNLTHLQKYCTFKIIEDDMQNQFEFKPFDQVLVRMDYHIHPGVQNKPYLWSTATFSHTEKTDDGRTTYCANSILWDECIPYNENTVHLVGTNKSYENKPSQEKKVHVWTSGTFNEWMTEDEFKNFIKTAVLNNRDITDFHVLYIR